MVPFASTARGRRRRRSPGSKRRSHSRRRPVKSASQEPAERLSAAARCFSSTARTSLQSLTRRLWSTGGPRTRRRSSTGWPRRAFSSATFQALVWFARPAATGRARTISNDSFGGFSLHSRADLAQTASSILAETVGELHCSIDSDNRIARSQFRPGWTGCRAGYL